MYYTQIRITSKLIPVPIILFSDARFLEVEWGCTKKECALWCVLAVRTAINTECVS
eukprot:SAG31_NODE_27705_length_421_cov_1.217391_1_plen_55_part_10